MNAESPYELLLRYSQPQQLHHSTAVVAIRGETSSADTVGVGSAIVVKVADSFWLLSARHNIVDGRAGGATTWKVEAMKMGNGERVLPLHDLELEDHAWTLASDDDLAMAPLPVAQLPNDHFVSGIAIERFRYTRFGPTPEVTLVGRWGEASDKNLIVTRRGIVATMQQPKTSYDIGLGERTTKDVFLVDATIMPGMSGGAVFTEGKQPDVLGVISAHQRITALPAAVSKLPDTARNAAEAIWRSLGPINTGMVYVIPFDRVQWFIRDVTTK